MLDKKEKLGSFIFLSSIFLSSPTRRPSFIPERTARRHYTAPKDSPLLSCWKHLFWRYYPGSIKKIPPEWHRSEFGVLSARMACGPCSTRNDKYFLCFSKFSFKHYL